ncbi:MAG TPA: DUF5996 family protein [Solirubrobacteraceae bacterium]|nr:DUF5996 family protein [Solirubrobacteraceae bacterium]
MPVSWPSVDYREWRETCDTLHAHTQVLGKLAVALAPKEPELQHSALRLTARGWETLALPAPDDSGAVVAALDLRTHEAVVEHTHRGMRRLPLTPDRPVADLTREMLEAVGAMAGPVEINPAPQEVPWSVPLDEDVEHSRYETEAVERYFTAATEAALVLAAFRAPYRGRSTPVNAWWGSFDLAVSLFSGAPADPPSHDFIMRNSMDAEEVAVGWWPGDERYERAAFYAYAHPAPEGFSRAAVAPEAARWDGELGEYVLDWNDIRERDDPRGLALDFGRSAFHQACVMREWAPALLASAEGSPPPVA